ncbi:TIR domain-containing protein [Nodosilinea sp. P-1105]|uniref:toll/interleukin-1 receptor domain-containing protein n=1 Tax=Nodosilinea sp. P-1105 TaxID=2546229 RepID=UPI00146BE42C|nr:TIR domain-containing protein [Nodosilinea sp. P-1105]NMF82153.1 TIR domain-containing protein [Nodosilinea sp. P-1105]
MAAFQDAFISYGRADSKAFAIALKEQLKVRGLSQVWLDLDDIPSGTDWQERIQAAIARSHQFVYIISPSAMASPYCQFELALAQDYGKRMIPLMHVEGGDFDTWASADPTGSTAIRQLNWIFFREGLDDPDTALAKLSRTLSFCDERTGQAQTQTQSYVHQHTTLLSQALSWNRHHRQTRYLLVGAERQAAETWLQTRTVNGDPLPCTPTDLHCEYITESTKNASNLMTQVFLCHSDQDQAPAEQIRRSLLRQGITVWNYRTDISTSQDYNRAIAQGIEEADNLIFLLSPHSAQSPYCQQELAQALTLHKRVIPVLAETVEPEQVPDGLRNLQHIDLTDNTQPRDYQADESQLLKLLNTDAAYHTEHKTWLVQALKWQRQQQNPTLLLRGYNLRRAETWLKVARNHRHPPTLLHEQFIAESLRQPPDAALDVFISYSRVDSDFARRLNEALQIQGKRTWFDQESIATGSDFQQEIYRGIESSDVFVFVLSPESVNSPFCADEVEYAQGLNKRMVTVLHRPIDTADLHPVLAKLQWLDFRDHDGDFQENFAGLLRTLATDREHLETHTRLLVRALEWDKKGRDEGLLLRGKELKTAELWIAARFETEPRPTGLQQEYIRSGKASEESKRKAERRLKRGVFLGLTAATAGTLVAGISGTLAFRFSEEVRNSRIEKAEIEQSSAINIREANERISRAEFREKEAQELVDKALIDLEGARLERQEAEVQLNQITRELQERIQEAEDKALESEGALEIAREQRSLAESARIVAESYREATELALQKARETLHLAQEGSRLERAGNNLLKQSSSDSRVRNINIAISAIQIGQELKDLSENYDLTILEYPATSPIIILQSILNNLSDSSNFLDHSSLRLVSFGLSDSEDIFTAIDLNSAGTYIALANKDGRIKVFSTNEDYLEEFPTNFGTISSLQMSPDGDRLATLSSDGIIRIWNHSGEVIRSFGDDENSEFLTDFVFSNDGQLLALRNGAGVVGIYRWSWQELRLIELKNVMTSDFGRIVSMSFDQSGKYLVTVGLTGEIKFRSILDESSRHFESYENQIRRIELSPDGKRIATINSGGDIQIWNLRGQLLGFFESPKGRALDLSFSQDGNFIIVSYESEPLVKYDIYNLNSLIIEVCNLLKEYETEYPRIKEECRYTR